MVRLLGTLQIALGLVLRLDKTLLHPITTLAGLFTKLNKTAATAAAGAEAEAAGLAAVSAPAVAVGAALLTIAADITAVAFAIQKHNQALDKMIEELRQGETNVQRVDQSSQTAARQVDELS